MIKVIRMEYKNRGRATPDAEYELICSERADLVDLPTAENYEASFADFAPHPGSTCLCTEDMSIHIYGADDKWHQM